jgi:predicted nucleotidyltransferase
VSSSLGVNIKIAMKMQLLLEKRNQILRLAASRGMSNVRVFGSFARGTATGKSDVDLLVDAGPSRSMLDVIGLWLDLEELLKRKVDLITEGGMHPRLRETILAEARPL